MIHDDIPIIINYRQRQNAVVLLNNPVTLDKKTILCEDNTVGKDKTIVKGWKVVPNKENYFDVFVIY